MDKYKELKQAAIDYNIRKVKYLLEQGFDLTGASLRDFFKFYAYEQYIQVPEKNTLLKLFIKAGIDVNSDGGETLSKAILHGYETMAVILLENGTDVKTPFGQFSLIYAAEKGLLNLVKKIIYAGADINDEDLLYSAAYEGQLQVIKYLLEQGAGKEYPEDIDNALEGAVTAGRLNIVKLLLRHGANPKANDERALKIALENGELKIAHVLYKHLYPAPIEKN